MDLANLVFKVSIIFGMSKRSMRMEKQKGTTNGHLKGTHPGHCNADRKSQPQAGSGLRGRSTGAPPFILPCPRTENEVARIMPSEPSMKVSVTAEAVEKGTHPDHFFPGYFLHRST